MATSSTATSSPKTTPSSTLPTSPISPPRSPRGGGQTTTGDYSTDSDRDLLPSPPESKTHSRTVSSASGHGSHLGRSGTCEDALDDEDEKNGRTGPRSRSEGRRWGGSGSGVVTGRLSGGGASDSDEAGAGNTMQQHQRQLTDSSAALELLLDEMTNGGSGGVNYRDRDMERDIERERERASTPIKQTPNSSRATSLSPTTTLQASPTSYSTNSTTSNTMATTSGGAGPRKQLSRDEGGAVSPPPQPSSTNHLLASLSPQNTPGNIMDTFSWLSPKSPINQEAQSYLSFPAGFTVGPTGGGSPTPSISGSKFTPLKRVKKGTNATTTPVKSPPPGDVSGATPPPAPASIHSNSNHAKRASINSGTTEVASAETGVMGDIDSGDYGIHGKKLATIYSNSGSGTVRGGGKPASVNGDRDSIGGGDVKTNPAADLVLLHISLIIPPSSSPAYARHQRRMLRRAGQHKRLGSNEDAMNDDTELDEGDSALLGSSDGDDTVNDASDSTDTEGPCEPGPLSSLSPVVYQRGILIPHPRGDYERLQREVGKALGLPFQDDEENWPREDDKDDDGGVRGKGWYMRVYARNGWLTKGAWERAWAEMERVDVEILETGTKKRKNSGTKSGRGSRAKKHKSGGKKARKARQKSPEVSGGGYAGVFAGQTNGGSGGLAGPSCGARVAYSDAGDNDSLDGCTPSVGAYFSDRDFEDDDDDIVDHHDNIELPESDIEDLSDDATDIVDNTAAPPVVIKPAPLQLENGTVGDGELEEAFRAHGEVPYNEDEAGQDEGEANTTGGGGLADVPEETIASPTPISPPSPTLPPKPISSRSTSVRRRGSSMKPRKSTTPKPPRTKSPFSSPLIGKPHDVHPYQYLLDLLKPIVLTGIVVTGAMFFLGPSGHKKNGLSSGPGTYGSWGRSDHQGWDAQYIDDDRVDMDQDVEDRCAGYAREAELWRSWSQENGKNSHHHSSMNGKDGDGGKSNNGNNVNGANGKKTGGDWTVTVTQTVTQRIVNAGATQIVVEIPSDDAQFPLGPLGFSDRGAVEEVFAIPPSAGSTSADGLPIETGGATGPVPTAPPGGEEEKKKDAAVAAGEGDAKEKKEEAGSTDEKVEGNEAAAGQEGEGDGEEKIEYIDAETPPKGGSWWKIL